MSRVKRNYTYAVGDIANAVPNWTLTCTKAGTTSIDPVDIQAGTIIDGTCEWNCVNSGGGGAVNNYSTEEQIIGTWIDGKPLYQRTYEISSSDSVMLSTDIVVKYIEGYVNNGDVNYIFIGSYLASNNFVQAYFDNTNHKITIAQQGYPSKPCYITIQYTKTTD